MCRCFATSVWWTFGLSLPCFSVQTKHKTCKNVNSVQQQPIFLCCREINESNLLLKEKTESLHGKLERSEQRNREMARLEIENEVRLRHSLDLHLCSTYQPSSLPSKLFGVGPVLCNFYQTNFVLSTGIKEKDTAVGMSRHIRN